MLGLAQFEGDACWAPSLDRHAQFGRIPLVRKQLWWFERTSLHATRVRNVSWVGSQALAWAAKPNTCVNFPSASVEFTRHVHSLRPPE